jgi:S-layer homology domain
MIRKLTKAVGVLLMLGFITPSLAMADPTTVAAAPADTTAATSAATADATDVAQAGPLSDVPQNSWAYDAVDQLAKDGIIKGYPDGTFKGNRPMTRYEAAVLAYRAVDMIEAQITAGKAVEKADIDAANKLIAAYGAELKAVERHVDALQQEADSTKSEADSTATTVAGHTGQIQALSDFDKKAYIKFTSIDTAFAYSGSVQGSCGNAAAYGAASGNAFCAANGPGAALPQGQRTNGYNPAVGTAPGGSPSNIPIGQANHGVSFLYQKISLAGTPSANTAFLVEMGTSDRPVQASGTSNSASSNAYCTPSSGQNFLNGNLAEPTTLSNCSATNASAAEYNNGEPGGAFGYNNIWAQVSIPTSGIYLRAGHVQNNEGPTGGSWLGGDYYWGVMLGMTKGNFNGYIGAGVGNSAATNQALDNSPYTAQNITIEADYTFPISSKFSVNLGGMYTNYTGYSSSEWDPSAVTCTGANGATRFFANTAAVPFTTCGTATSGGVTQTLTPLTYANGTAITGAYLSAANNNNTISGTGCTCLPASAANQTFSLSTPGLVTTLPISQLGGHLILTYANARLYLAGTVRFGNDPYALGGPSSWAGNTTGDFVFDLGPWRAGPGNHGKVTYEAQGFAAGFNSLTQNNNYFGGPILSNTWQTAFGGQYWIESAFKYWVSDNVNLAVGFGRSGLLPNVLLPAGGPTCPGCVITGFGQNMAFAQMNLNF